MHYRCILIVLTFFCQIVNAKPKLAVNIVVSGMRSTDLEYYSRNFGKGGFLRLSNGGAKFSECYIDYAPTYSPAGAATIATGAMPSVHGIVSESWYDRTNNRRVQLCEAVSNNYTKYDNGVSENYSTDCMTSNTLAEAVLSGSSNARAVTIAHTAQSAMLTAGRKGECYWLDANGNWCTANCYTSSLPMWVRSYNNDGYNKIFSMYRWYGKYTRNTYVNSRSSALTLYETDTKIRNASQKSGQSSISDTMLSTPSGNVALFEFAKRTVGTMFPIRMRDGVKILNIYLDTPRIVAEKYGPDSIEYEDMLYCLDDVLSDFLVFLYAQVDEENEIVVSLTSDHGTSPSHIDTDDSSKFNAGQFEVILNAFLSARYGQDEWVSGFDSGSLYMNHSVIYKHKKSLAEIRDEVASFALQFRGVAYALSASALQNNGFGNGVPHLIQNGFYPSRSGDIVICMVPERIYESTDRVSMSGSPYIYDRHVPLLIYGGGVKPQNIDNRTDLTSLAPTIAKLVGVERPSSSEAEIIKLDIQ